MKNCLELLAMVNQLAKVETLFKLNIASNPKSANCYDSPGELYLRTDNKTEAIYSFKKALALKEIPESRERLEKLLNEENTGING